MEFIGRVGKDHIELYACPKCGAVVNDSEQHVKWHELLGNFVRDSTISLMAKRGEFNRIAEVAESIKEGL